MGSRNAENNVTYDSNTAQEEQKKVFLPSLWASSIIQQAASWPILDNFSILGSYHPKIHTAQHNPFRLEPWCLLDYTWCWGGYWICIDYSIQADDPSKPFILLLNLFHFPPPINFFEQRFFLSFLSIFTFFKLNAFFLYNEREISLFDTWNVMRGRTIAEVKLKTFVRRHSNRKKKRAFHSIRNRL